MRRPLLVLVLALTLLSTAVACGGGEDNSVERGAVEAHEDASALEGDASAGEKVWVTAGCEACHTLSAANATGTVGPNLDEAAPSAEFVVDRVALGYLAMPTYQGILTPQQMADVGAYVAEVTPP